MFLTNFINSDLYYYLFNGRAQIWEYIVLPLYLFVIFIHARRTQRLKIETNPEYKYYLTGLTIKIIGVLGFCLIYLYYYDGGDTFYYFENAKGLVKLLWDYPSNFISIILDNRSSNNLLVFSKYSIYLSYWRDTQAFFVIRLITPFNFLGMNCYVLTSVLIAYVTYSGVWKLYQLFVELFPDMKKEMAIAILFMPSVAFWGSGILKDSWTLAATGWLTYSFYRLFIKKKKGKFIYHVITAFISSYIVFSIKPYILFSLLFGFLIWIIFYHLKSIKSTFHRVLIFPTIFLFSWVIGSVILSNTGKVIGGDYENIDKMINKADIIRKDLSRTEQYGGNNFDIGYYDKNNFVSILGKVPQAIVAGLFRPFLWETRNVVMALSGLENLIVMFFTLFIVFRKGPLFLINTLFDNPLILFSFVFAIVFAFSIGFSTSNFGALVRYKIPLVPFFMAALFFVRSKQIKVVIEDEKRKQLYVPQSGLKV